MPVPGLPRLDREQAGERPLIPAWARVLVILTVIPTWAALCLWSLFVLKKLPGAEWTLVPSAVVAAVAPAWRARRAEPATGGGATPDGGGSA